MRTGALFSPCDGYRYTLTRQWDVELPTLCVCGLNPSTADAEKDDPTIRREIGFARDLGFGRLVKVNAYGWRSTDPKGLWKCADPNGPDNWTHVVEEACAARKFVAAWGNNIRLADEHALVTILLRAGVNICAFSLTKDGHPGHPLYLPKTSVPFLWRTKGAA